MDCREQEALYDCVELLQVEDCGAGLVQDCIAGLGVGADSWQVRSRPAHPTLLISTVSCLHKTKSVSSHSACCLNLISCNFLRRARLRRRVKAKAAMAVAEMMTMAPTATLDPALRTVAAIRSRSLEAATSQCSSQSSP